MPRTDIVLHIADLPSADRDRLAERTHAIETALRSGPPLQRTFDPRETLADTIARLSDLGVDIGDGAVINFDHLEAAVPDSRRAEIEQLPFVRFLRDPVIATPSSHSGGTPHCGPGHPLCQSEGLAEIGAQAANAAGITGAGVTVAIIDDGFRSLTDTANAGELPAIAGAATFLVRTNLTVVTPAPGGLNALSPVDFRGEHGTAAAEVVHEVAPGATLHLYGLQSATDGSVTISQIQKAIREATDRGAKVILVAMGAITTMRDPRAITQGGTNPFTDDIDYASAAGATVVVAAGNEALSHIEETFAPCTDCTDAPGSGICESANNDTRYHKFDVGGWEDPRNEIVWVEEYEFDLERIDQLVCYTATDAANPQNFRWELRRYSDGGDFFPICPRDNGSNIVGSDRALGASLSRKNDTLYTPDFDEFIYALSVYRTPGETATPRFRIACTTGVEELTYPPVEDGEARKVGSLSDLAAVTNALSVAAYVPGPAGIIWEPSSQGPTALSSGPIKPDVTGPGDVSNFTTLSWGASFDSNFMGTSAAAAHAAGVVALMQHKRAMLGLAPLTPAQVRAQIKDAAVDQGAIGDDPVSGAGLLRIPESVFTAPPMDDLTIDFGSFGLWELKNESIWTQIHGNTVGATGVGDLDGNGKDDLIASFPSFGVWAWKNDATWVNINGNPAEAIAPGDIDGTRKDDAVIDFGGFGLWVFKNAATYQKLHALSPESLEVCDLDGSGKADVIADFGTNFGLWLLRNDAQPGSGWEKLHAASPTDMICGDVDGSGKDDLVINFGPSFGIWIYRNDLTFVQIHGASPASLEIADLDGGGKDDLIANFGPSFGIWTYKNNTAWTQIHSIAPTAMSAGDYDGSSQEDLAVDFGAPHGVWVYKNDTSWVKRHGATTSGMDSGNVDGL